MSGEHMGSSRGGRWHPLAAAALGLVGACAGSSPPAEAPPPVGSSSVVLGAPLAPVSSGSAGIEPGASSTPVASSAPVAPPAPAPPPPVAPGPVVWAACPAAWTKLLPASFDDFSSVQGATAEASDWFGIWSDGPPGACTHLFAIGRDAAGDVRLVGATCGKQRRGVYAPALSGDHLQLDFLIDGMDRTEQVEVDRKGERATGVRQVVNEDGPTGKPLRLTLQRRCR